MLTYGGRTPYWQVLADNNAGGGAPLVNNWVVQNRAVPVPVGEWFKFEIFWHRSNGADGRVWAAVNGNVICDQSGPNMGAWNLPINRISSPTVYTGSRMPVYQWIDDLEIWDGFPPAGTPAPTDTTAPSVPTGLAGTAVSSTQINLTWNASTDNVAVTSYQVYLNNVMIANTMATSFQHTGLTPSTTYNYRVSAADAVPNYSAWTAVPVSVTTPVRRALRSDFNGDGKSDILWHNSATGSNSIWLMNGTTISGGATNFATVTDLNWGIAGVGDFDGDGKSDILWRNGVTGEISIWFMNGATILSQPVFGAVTDLNWSITGGR